MSEVRVAAVGDLHVGAERAVRWRERLAPVSDAADLLLLAGDLTQNGTRAQAHQLVDALREVTVPVIAVLGNHDLDAGEADEVRRILERASVCVLEGSALTVSIRGCAVGIAGTIGFGGGFAGARVADFGEAEMKAFAARSRLQSEGLESALQGLDADVRIALLHYSPAQNTLEGERRELFPLLGCEELGAAIDAAGADLALHGHAHFGCEEGTTSGGVAVRNVAEPVIRAAYRVFAFAKEA